MFDYWIRIAKKSQTILNLRDFCFYYSWLAYNKFQYSNEKVSDPLKVHWVNLDEIRKASIFAHKGKRLNLKKIAGLVRDGNWDRNCFSADELMIYKSFKERFIENKPWEDTVFYGWHINRIKKGIPSSGFHSIESFRDQRLPFLDKLFKDIKTHGYLTQKQLGRPFNPFEEILIHIDRHGEYQFVNGQHRFAIARILGLKMVPVLILLRHSQLFSMR